MAEIDNGNHIRNNVPFHAFTDVHFIYFNGEDRTRYIKAPSLFTYVSELDEIVSTDWERTAKDNELLDEVFFWSRQHNFGRTKTLIMDGANVNCITNSGDTPLHLVHNPVMGALLIEHGAHIDAVGPSGFTPLHIAARQYNYSYLMIPTLLFYNADTSIRDQRGNTPIMYLMNTYSEFDHLITFLLNYEHDFSSANEAGSSLLSRAMIFKPECFVNTIIERGGNFSSLSRDLEVFAWCCFDQEDVEELRWFWNVFNYKDAWFFKQPILYFLLEEHKYEAFDFIIQSPQLQDVLDVWLGDHKYKKGTLLYKQECEEEKFTLVSILEAIGHSFNVERANVAIRILLCKGYKPTEHEVMEMYKVFGYGELFVLCLNLDVSGFGSPYSFTSLIPKILLNPDRSSQEIINECVLSESDCRMKSRELLIATISHVFHRSSHKFLKVVNSSQRMVPSLKELSRNQSLLGIWKKYKVKKRSLLFNVLNNISVPTAIKDLILFKPPICDFSK